MKKGLTQKQVKVLNFIKNYIDEYSYSPSYEEIKKHIGLASKSGVHNHIILLSERNWITRIIGKARSVRIAK